MKVKILARYHNPERFDRELVKGDVVDVDDQATFDFLMRDAPGCFALAGKAAEPAPEPDEPEAESEAPEPDASPRRGRGKG